MLFQHVYACRISQSHFLCITHNIHYIYIHIYKIKLMQCTASRGQIFFFHEASRGALVQTQSPIQWVPGDFSPQIMHEVVTSIQTQRSE